MSSEPLPQILVIFGASGDLSHRKLIPALFSLHAQRLLPSRFVVLGVGRTDFSDEGYRAEMRRSLDKFVAPTDGENQVERDAFIQRLHYLTLRTEDGADYGKLSRRLHALRTDLDIAANVIFYLSTPPELSRLIPGFLAAQNLHDEDDGFKRIVVEKPFGRDLSSARELNALLKSHYREHQIYRIDHYLGKETVQNVVVLRFANEIFSSVWNYRYVDYVEITAAESLGVEKRAGYFDQSGLIRDMIQNHLLQVLAMVAMDPPQRFNADCVRSETMKVFRSLRALSADDLEHSVVLGQYTASKIRGAAIPAYRDEVGVPPESRTETFAAIKLYLDHTNWYNVPFYLRAGKRMPTRVTEVVLHFKRSPHPIFGAVPGVEHNKLIIRIQPDEGIVFKFGFKEPGNIFQVKNVNMNFHYKDLANTRVPDSYERLLLDAMQGDSTLFAHGDAVEACWNFIDPILKHQESSGRIFGYPAGSWGPKEADAMMERDGRSWRYPCKNLTDDGDFCEL
jgi:glucose-6-phosphate 1-dehydrogenase